jgi:hypothetical protein
MLLRVGVHEVDPVGLHQREDLLDLLGRRADLLGEHLVDLLVAQEAPLASQSDELPYLLVLLLDREPGITPFLGHGPSPVRPFPPEFPDCSDHRESICLPSC